MDFVSSLIVAAGLAMDAFAVSVSGGVSIKRLQLGHMLRYGIYFGGFQFLMSFLGYLFGSAFSKYIRVFAPWIAFVLLTLIGANMLRSTFKKEGCCEAEADEGRVSAPRMLLLAIATSIDALAVGVSIAMLRGDIFLPATIIGGGAFLLSMMGVFIGNRLGCVFQKGAERLGGIMLIGIGIKIILEHLLTGG